MEKTPNFVLNSHELATRQVLPVNLMLNTRSHNHPGFDFLSYFGLLAVAADDPSLMVSTTVVGEEEELLVLLSLFSANSLFI